MTKYAERLTKKKLFFIETAGVSSAITVWVRDATQNVTIQGHALHAVRGEPGKNFACALANTAMDKENKSVFPHSAILAAFLKSTAFIVTAEKHEGLSIAVRYSHSYGSLVDMNDERVSQQKAKEDPDFFERTYLLRIPRLSPQVPNHLRNKSTNPKRSRSHRAYFARGSLARALKAGLVAPELARTMLKSSKVHSYDRKTTESALKEKRT